MADLKEDKLVVPADTNTAKKKVSVEVNNARTTSRWKPQTHIIPTET